MWVLYIILSIFENNVPKATYMRDHETFSLLFCFHEAIDILFNRDTN